MDGYLYIAPGDITQLAADAIAYSCSTSHGRSGNLYPAFHDQVPGFAEQYAALAAEHGRRCQVGDAFWLPLHPGRRPFGVVVVPVVGRGQDRAREKPSRVAVAAAIDTAVKHLRAGRGRRGRLLVALPAFRVGRGGDRHDRLRAARAQVEAAAEALGRHPNTDVAFVTYTPTLYQIFLEARRNVLGEPPDDPLRPAALERALIAGECVLFAGAGLSRGAGLPDWSELIDRLARELGLEPRPELDYLDLAQWYREHFGRARLADVLREIFVNRAGHAKPTLAHYLLLALPLRHILTTNYDDLLEQALTGLKRFPVKVMRQEDVARTGRGDDVYVVKLHGDASSAEEIVLSRDDYDAFFEERPALALLLEGLLLNQTFFFVGYGLRDPNFRQIYSRIARMLRDAHRPAFATTFGAAGDAGQHLAEQWKNKQLHLIRIPGADPTEQEQQFLRFLDRLADRVTTANASRLFLAPDVEAAPVLHPLREQLLAAVGDEIPRLCREDLSAPHLHHLATVLGFLADHGWQPRGHGVDLGELWERLAQQTADSAVRKRLLIAALKSAGRFDDVRRLQEQLRQIEATDGPPPGAGGDGNGMAHGGPGR